MMHIYHTMPAEGKCGAVKLCQQEVGLQVGD